MIERLDGLSPINPQISNGGVYDSPATSSEQINLFSQTADPKTEERAVSDVFDSSFVSPKAVRQREKEQSEKADTPVQEAENLQLDKIIERLNEKMSLANRQLQFRLDERIGRNYISIIDKQTRETIKEFPPEEIRNFMAQVIEFEKQMMSGGQEETAGELMINIEV